MRPALTIILILMALAAIAQRSVSLKSGSFSIPPFNSATAADTLPSFAGKAYAFVDFGGILAEDQQQALRSSGVELLESADGIYLLRVPSNRSWREINPRPDYLGTFASELKISPYLQDATEEGKEFQVRVRHADGIDEDVLVSAIAKAGGVVGESPLQSGNILNVSIRGSKLLALAEIAPILWIEPEPEPDQLIRYQAAANARASFVINAMGLTGAGVTIGIGDGGKVGSHLDLNGNLQNYAYGGVSTHATHVSGIAGGTPELNPDQGSGTAPEAELVTSFFSTIISDAERHMEDHDMSITNNSYGSSLTNCELMGDYNLTSIFIDQQLAMHDTLLHVFAAGNSGNMTCVPYSGGYATILTGYQSTKNALCVGSCTKTDALSSFSSRGPVDDGRIKPDIVAVGSSVRSTRPNNIYQGGSGTSYSAPSITGISALVSEQYKTIYGTKPSSALIKAAIMNTADDLGVGGPDYLWGYGRVNARRAISAIADGRFTSGSVSHGDSITIEVPIPDQTGEMRVMLLWTDPAAAPFATPTLRNDLDLVVELDGAISLPWVLNPSPDYVAMPATRGRDSVNNQEQVTIVSPAAQSCSIVIRGNSIPIGSQDFVVVWEFVHDEITITHPSAGTKFIPGKSERIRWDAYGAAEGPFTIEYSLDSGEWQTLADNYNAARRWYDWTVPDTFCSNMAFRIAHGVYSDTASQDIAIVHRPDDLAIQSPCSDYADISWTEVEEAAYYGIYRYDGANMTFSDTSHTGSYLAEDLTSATEWFSVSTFLNDSTESLRAKAVAVSAAGTTGCPWAKDLMVIDRLNLSDGRKFTSTELSNNESIEVSYVNIGSDTIFNISAGYQLGWSSPVEEFADVLLPPGDTGRYTFTNSIDLSAEGNYAFTFWARADGDIYHTNDTASVELQQVGNPAVTLPWNEGFESTSPMTLLEETFAFGDMAEWDYSQQTGPGRLRTFAGNAFAIDGHKAITLDGNAHNQSAIHAITATLNMSSYSVSENDIRLAFDFMHHEIAEDNDSNDIVVIRGSDTSQWIAIMDLYDYHNSAGETVSFAAGIPISEKLELAGQDFSSSFQIRFTQEGSYPAGDTRWEDGYTFDNIELFEVGVDLDLAEVIAPTEVNCDLIEVFPVVRIVNTTDTFLGDVNLTIAFEGDTLVNSVKVPPLVDSNYTFSSPLDLTGISQSTFSAWISHPADERLVNDSLREKLVLNFPFISEMPYFEDFEQGTGGWTTSGINSSFEHGTPANAIIRSAASGQKAWVTGLISNYNTNEFSYLTSPCMNTSGLAQPYLSFAHTYRLEDNYDFVWVEYSTDGITWNKLGEVGEGYQWYNDPSTDAWDGVNSQWHVASIPLPQADRIQVRFVMQSDVGLEYEGVGIDAVHVHDALEIYSGPSTSPDPLVVAGNAWQHISIDGQTVVSIHPNGQDLGNITTDYYSFEGPVREDGSAYFLDNNVVISSSIPPEDTIRVRLYFGSPEFESINAATTCDGCVNPADPFRIVGRKFSGVAEDSILENNTSGETLLFGHPQISIIPIGEGYAAEFQTDGFSEFWLTSPVVKQSDTIEIALRSSSDDASEFTASGGVNPNADSLVMTSAYATGLRFADIDIPPGSFISSARLKLTTWSSGSISDMTITGQNAANAEGFTTGNFNITGRSRTDRHAEWSVSATAAGTEITSPPLRTIVQEIVDMEEWRPGNAIALILEGNGAQTIYAVESDPGLSARLEIAYDTVCSASNRLYVDSAATGAKTGESWTNAFTDLQSALDLASRCPDIEEVWVARGMYVPALDNPLCSFEIPAGIRIYGGFDGSESLLGERAPELNSTILSGNIGSINHSSDNSYNVIHIAAITDTAFIDGFIICDGFAYGPFDEHRRGAGIYSLGHIAINDCIIENCTALESGSAIFQTGTNAVLKLTNCTLRNNDPPHLRSEGGSEVLISNTNKLKND